MRANRAAILILIALSSWTPAWSQPIIADHTCTDISAVPPAFIDSAKANLKMSYGHTSHGSQIVSGMGVLMSQDTLFDFHNDHNYYRYGSGSPALEGDLSLWDYVPSGDLGNPDRSTWATRTDVMLSNSDGAYDIYPHGRNLVVWSWCGQAATSNPADIDLYLSLMTQLEADYPDVTFVYMTGHLNGTGETGYLHLRNEQIRQYCRDSSKVLFDFADIESYDPDGEYFLDRGAEDDCDYNGGNWADEWCAEHEGDPLCETCSCAHSRPLNCNLKARAFWWLLARLAGWEPQPGNLTIICEGLDVSLDWDDVPGASSYQVLSSIDCDSGFTEDTTGTFDGSSWSAPLPPDELRFYQVIAVY